MKCILLFSIVSWSMLIGLTSASGALADVEIKVARKKLDQEVASRGNQRIEVKEIIYTITVQSKTFKQLSNLEAKYMIFYYDSEPGSPDKPVEKSLSGNEKIIALASNRATSFETKAISLTTVTLDGGWYYSGGAGNKSKDRVSGVWVRVYGENGALVGEFTSGGSMSKRVWKE